MRTVRVMKRYAVLSVLLTLVLSSSVFAAAGPWSKPATGPGPLQARLVAAVEGVGEGDAAPLALEIRLQPGWKTYWRSPGDAGLPPEITWTGSTNLKEARFAYPAPRRMTTLGIETVGYEGDVTFPVRAVPIEAGKPLDLKAGVDMLVCSQICVPQHVDVGLSLPAGPALAGAEANIVSRAENTAPGDGRAAGLEIRAIRTQGAALEVEATAREPFDTPDVFVELEPPLVLTAPTVRLSDGGHTAVLRFHVPVPDAPEAADLVGRQATLTLVDGARSLETRSTVVSAPVGGSVIPVEPSLLPMLGVALLGGLILNLMPCVLPVLSLKLLHAVQHSGAPPRAVRAGFLASAAGIIVSFLLLAGIMVILKAAGGAVGWGIQFQQPLFLVFMVVLVTLFAANLWGLFEIPLPRALADTLAGPQEGHSLAGPFASGVVATLLATPCSAPFLGTAVGFALARGPLEIVLIFAVLGIGLALPYLAVAAFPRVARFLPRPGRWMLGLRRVLAVALALTGAWLLTIMAVQVGGMAAGLVAVLMAGLVLVLFVWPVRWIGGALAGVLVLVAFALPVWFGQRADAAPTEAARWAAFDEVAIREHVAAGRTVFVDVTADWCITCQANKKLVINRGEVAARLQEDSIVSMRADWTRPDARITAYLAAHGRYGIPFNIVYGPGAPDGVPLPELLSEDSVIKALDRASVRP